MLQALAIIELIIQVILLRAKIISMGLRTFGIRQKEYCGNTMVLTEMPFRYLFKECEFRFNYGSPKQQLKTLLKWTEI